MKILLSNRELKDPGGSEVWVYTMHKALLELGHEVDVFTPTRNTLYPHMAPFRRLPGKYDVGILNHAGPTMIPMVLQQCETVVHTRHGVIPGAEKPTRPADIYVSVSEETQEATLDQYKKESVVIRNPVDTEFFFVDKWKERTGLKPSKILVLSNNPGNGLIDLLHESLPYATVRGVGRTYGNLCVSREAMREHFLWADLVVTLGRGCYEAMACGRQVIPIDWSGGDKLITVDNFEFTRTHNCSGRAHKIEWDAKDLTTEIEQRYDNSLETDLNMRKLIVDEHNSLDIANQYLELLK